MNELKFPVDRKDSVLKIKREKLLPLVRRETTRNRTRESGNKRRKTACE